MIAPSLCEDLLLVLSLQTPADTRLYYFLNVCHSRGGQQSIFLSSWAEPLHPSFGQTSRLRGPVLSSDFSSMFACVNTVCCWISIHSCFGLNPPPSNCPYCALSATAMVKDHQETLDEASAQQKNIFQPPSASNFLKPLQARSSCQHWAL